MDEGFTAVGSRKPVEVPKGYVNDRGEECGGRSIWKVWREFNGGLERRMY